MAATFASSRVQPSAPRSASFRRTRRCSTTRSSTTSHMGARATANHDEIVAAAHARQTPRLRRAAARSIRPSVGERGLKLSGEKSSGGHRTRVLKSPPILIVWTKPRRRWTRSPSGHPGGSRKLSRRAHDARDCASAVHHRRRGRDPRRSKQGPHRRARQHADLLGAEARADVVGAKRQERELRRSKHRAAVTPINLAALVTDAMRKRARGR